MRCECKVSRLSNIHVHIIRTYRYCALRKIKNQHSYEIFHKLKCCKTKKQLPLIGIVFNVPKYLCLRFCPMADSAVVIAEYLSF